MSTFIHNEPTSLSVLQELKLPDVFLERIRSKDFPVSAEVAIVIPHAFGAICLNETGLARFQEVNPLESFLEIFFKSTTVPELLENDVPHIVGTALDELVRHHPSLNTSVLSAIGDLLGAVLELGKAQDPIKFSFLPKDSIDSPEYCKLFLDDSAQMNMDAEPEGIKFTKHLDCIVKVYPRRSSP